MKIDTAPEMTGISKDWFIFFQEIDALWEGPISYSQLKTGMMKALVDFSHCGEFKIALRGAAGVLEETPEKLERLQWLFSQYNSTPYSLDKSKEIITASLLRLSEKYGESVPLVYTTLLLPTPYNYLRETWSELSSIAAFEKLDYGHLDFLHAIQSLRKDNIIKSIVFFNIISVCEKILTIKMLVQYQRPKERKSADITSLNLGSVPIFYNEITGMGNVGKRRFKFKDHRPEYRIFGRLYNRINKKMLRNDVLVAGGFYEDYEEPNPVRKTQETAFINNIAKEIRKRSGLGTSQLVNNNGNLTLIGKKLKTIEPNASQN